MQSTRSSTAELANTPVARWNLPPQFIPPQFYPPQFFSPHYSPILPPFQSFNLSIFQSFNHLPPLSIFQSFNLPTTALIQSSPATHLPPTRLPPPPREMGGRQVGGWRATNKDVVKGRAAAGELTGCQVPSWQNPGPRGNKGQTRRSAPTVPAISRRAGICASRRHNPDIPASPGWRSHPWQDGTCHPGHCHPGYCHPVYHHPVYCRNRAGAPAPLSYIRLVWLRRCSGYHGRI